MAATKDQIRREVSFLRGRSPSQEELAAVKASADRLSLNEGDTWLHGMILFEEANQRSARIEDAISRRDEGFLVRLERRIPWALLVLVAIVALAFGYALGAQR